MVDLKALLTNWRLGLPNWAGIGNWGEILRGLANLSEVTQSFQQKLYALRAELTGHA